MEGTLQHPFSFGVTLERLAVQSVDEDWQPKFLPGKMTVMRKVGASAPSPGTMFTLSG